MGPGGHLDGYLIQCGLRSKLFSQRFGPYDKFRHEGSGFLSSWTVDRKRQAYLGRKRAPPGHPAGRAGIFFSSASILSQVVRPAVAPSRQSTTLLCAESSYREKERAIWHWWPHLVAAHWLRNSWTMAVTATQLVANGINHFCHGKGVVAGAETGSSLDWLAHGCHHPAKKLR